QTFCTSGRLTSPVRRGGASGKSGQLLDLNHWELTGSGFSFRLTGVQKMEDRDLKEDRAEPPESSCPSMSVPSKKRPPDFSNEPGPSEPESQNHTQRAGPPGSSCPSMSSDFSKERPPDFSNEPGPSEPK
ncbi:hypothetical protein GOODEAATRI_028916, partial [Goodea atripinnis]